MIYLAITPAGLTDAMRIATSTDAVWCGSGAVSDVEFALMRDKPSRFIYSFTDDTATDDLDGAVHTIAEHHPGQTIWVEALPSP